MTGALNHIPKWKRASTTALRTAGPQIEKSIRSIVGSVRVLHDTNRELYFHEVKDDNDNNKERNIDRTILYPFPLTEEGQLIDGKLAKDILLAHCSMSASINYLSFRVHEQSELIKFGSNSDFYP